MKNKGGCQVGKKVKGSKGGCSVGKSTKVVKIKKRVKALTSWRNLKRNLKGQFVKPKRRRMRRSVTPQLL